MYCKDCKFRQVSETDDPVCNSESIRELDTLYKESGSRLLYSYPENGRFYVEDYFGCVHFEPLETATWKDLASQAESMQKRVSAVESSLCNIRNKCQHLNLPARQLGEQFMDICPDCGFVNYCYFV